MIVGDGQDEKVVVSAMRMTSDNGSEACHTKYANKNVLNLRCMHTCMQKGNYHAGCVRSWWSEVAGNGAYFDSNRVETFLAGRWLYIY